MRNFQSFSHMQAQSAFSTHAVTAFAITDTYRCYHGRMTGAFTWPSSMTFAANVN